MNNKIKEMIFEELSKKEVSSLINQKIDSNLTSKEFEKKVKELAASVMNEFFKILWQKNSLWKNSVVK